MVELSMVDREYGIVTKQTEGTNIDVIHVITQRTLKQGVPPLVDGSSDVPCRSSSRRSRPKVKQWLIAFIISTAASNILRKSLAPAAR